MKLDGVRQKVFLDRYSLKDKAGSPMEKTPDEMWRRVAKGIAGQEKKPLKKLWEKKFYDAMELPWPGPPLRSRSWPHNFKA